MATKTLTISQPSNGCGCRGNCGGNCAVRCTPIHAQNCPPQSCVNPCKTYQSQCNGGCNSCTNCDAVILMPVNPAILVAPNLYISAAAVPNNCGQLSVSFDDAILVNPAAPLSAGDFRALCLDDYVRLILLTA